MKAFLFANPFRFFALLLALFVAGCAANSLLQVSGSGTGFERLYALIPCFLFFLARLTIGRS